MKMKLITAIMSLLIIISSNAWGYEKWEKLYSNKYMTCYIDDNSISKVHGKDGEYNFDMMYEYKKPLKLQAVKTFFKTGKEKNITITSNKYVMKAVITDNKIYFQTSYYIIPDDTVSIDVSPSMNIDSSDPDFERIRTHIDEYLASNPLK
jgi:hypothetical protein